MEFKAQNLDLELILTGYNGKAITYTPSKIMTAKEVGIIIDKMNKLEENIKEEKASEGITRVATCITYVYPVSVAELTNNFDLGTLNDILTEVASILKGVKKKEKN